MKVIFRADDVGYTHVHNLGTWKTLEEGFTTHCDVMLDSLAVEEALVYLKEKPWISVGWHTHFWGKPVLDSKVIPSLMNANGRLKWQRINQSDHPVEGIVYDEILKECYAEAERCRRILGRYPDTCNNFDETTELGKALKTVCDDLKIPYGFLGGLGAHDKIAIPRDDYKELHITEYFTSGKHPATPKLRVNLFDQYDPAAAIVDMPIKEDVIWERSLHPGYLDDLVLEEQHCTIHRVKDVEAYCDQRVFDWIIANKIELINRNDALFGTHQYQDHLKEINSPLWVGNFK
ncbi:ChbG/HpnK family deacetylase [Dielma fastidiosa]|uniref:ChbG/HpnK family deacetylase n=1 Tax=Dielma fastidiosa TaxID=1034346 RepID=UPI0035671883